MRDGKPQRLESIALSAKALKNIQSLAWPKGAILSCPVCLRRSEKTPEQMNKYLKKWPVCCGVPAQVKPKY